MDLTGEVSCVEPNEWTETPWSIEGGYGRVQIPDRHVVCVDYGAKRNILRSLAGLGCRVTVVPAPSSAASILALRPNGIFLSNGPGDPSATSIFAVPVIRELLASGVPIFGICLGHQLLALALGARTVKMDLGHRGGNHPVQDLESGRVEITSQNHGFVVSRQSLPAQLEETHISLFDGTLEGLRVKAAGLLRAVPPRGQSGAAGQSSSVREVREPRTKLSLLDSSESSLRDAHRVFFVLLSAGRG
jgi:carbamoyl-phosphate synthase small subunit